MKLNNKILIEKNINNYTFPNYDRENMIRKTTENPKWIHFGAGNIFRSFICQLQEDKLNSKNDDTGIIVCETFDEEIVEKVYKPYDNLFINVLIDSNGVKQKNIIGCISESLALSNDFNRLKEIFQNSSLELISMTVTEKAYSYKTANGKFLENIERDINQFDNVKSLGAVITKLLYFRFIYNKKPLTLMSFDNCSNNGELLQELILLFANEWLKKKDVCDDFVKYINGSVTFPCTVIDKITPRPNENVLSEIKKDGFENMDIYITNKNTHVAPFVNSEKFQLLGIEDILVGENNKYNNPSVIYSNKETIKQIENMKVCTCLNPLHTAMSILGCLLSYDYIHEVINDEYIRKFINELAYNECLPVVTDPKVVNPEEFLYSCLNERFTNEFLEDSPWRIIVDTSKKIPIRFGDTLKKYIQQGRDVDSLKCIPFVFACWLRFLLGQSDKLEQYEIPYDPIYNEIQHLFKNIKVGKVNDLSSVRSILSNEDIFGINLYTCSLGNKVEDMFNELLVAPNSVANKLKKMLT